MDTLGAYDSDDDTGIANDIAADDDIKESVAETPHATTIPVTSAISRLPDHRRHVMAAPAITLNVVSRESQLTAGTMITSSMNDPNAVGPKRPPAGDLVLYNNPNKAVLYQPIQGPAVMDPATQKDKTLKGLIETNVAIEEVSFAEQRMNFQRSGMAIAPSGEVALRTTLGYSKERLQQFADAEERRAKRPRPQTSKAEAEAQLVQGSDDEAEYGIWAPPSSEEVWAADNAITVFQKGELAPEQMAERAYFAEKDRQRGIAAEKIDDESAQDRLVERKMAHLLPPKLNGDAPMEATTTFHGQQEFDYKGQSWIVPPAGLGSIRADGGAELGDHKCKVPLKCVHRFTGHNQGVHRIRLFPVTGHLLLSAGLDGKCKVWSIAEKQVMRTYIGHSAAVRDVQFNLDGTKFVSASFDRYLRLWNTETGSVLQTFTNRRVPYVVQFYPHDDNFFVVGYSNNRIVTYNATTAEITQEYNHHLAPVNAILFVEDNGTKMVTTSDDKKVLVWEWDIGVPIKYISDPSMQSMPCLVMHPSERFFVGQSLDNTIVVFQAGNKFAMQKKKKFTGHIVSGYACEMAFSPDGQFMVSGDGNGSLFFWDWKKHKILQKYRAHTSGPTACCVWHPLEPSTMFSCGWDGIIKMWK